MENRSRRRGELSYRWVYVAQNLLVDENVGKVVALLKRAGAAGYNGMVLADYKLGILDRVPDNYFRNLATVKAEATKLGIGIFPTVCSCGYDSALLAHDPNLAEGLPVIDAPFVVSGGTADIERPSAPALPGGAFDDARGDSFVGWDFQDEPGKMSFVDRTVKRGGASSLRFDAPGRNNPGSGNARVSRRVVVRPYSQWHLSVWIKTRGFDAAGDIHCTVLTDRGDSAPARSLCHQNANVKPDQDWTEHHFVFNTLDSSAVRAYVGCWGGRNGSLWLDDMALDEVGLLNVVRRDGCPLTVKGDDGTLYSEGRDFEPVVDPRMGKVPWDGEFETWHTPPALRVTPNSRIKNGQRLKVSFYHAVTIYDAQVAASLVDPKVFALHDAQIKRVQKELSPPGFFLSHDELRVAGWSADEQATKKTSGELLAAHVARCSQMVRAAAPKAERLVWSDMFDPHHNAVDNYYLVRGTLAGSWEGLPRDTMVMNWNSGKAAQSLEFFARRGHRQILAGYYDGPVTSIKRWLETAARASEGGRVVGVMYTTWRNNYADLEAFAKAAWG